MLKKISLLSMLLIIFLAGCGKNTVDNDVLTEIFDDYKIVLTAADELLLEAINQCETSRELR